LFLLLTSIYKSHHLYIMWSLFRIVYIWWFRKHFPVLSSFMTYRGVCDQIITTGTISGAGMAYPSGPPEFTPIFSGVRVTRSLALCVYFVDHFLSFYTFSVGHCVVCPSSIYGFWLPPCYLLAIVLSVLLRFTDYYYYPFGICWPLCCLFFFDLRICITPLVSVGHCVVCSSSIYGLLLPLWYLLAIVLSVLLRFTDSYYPFDICWPLCCLFFFDLRILITPLVSVGHCVVCFSSIYEFLLPLWYLLAIVLSVFLRFTDSYYPFGICWPLCCLFFFDLRILITPLISSNSSCYVY
jgi:hypothetical protein